MDNMDVMCRQEFLVQNGLIFFLIIIIMEVGNIITGHLNEIFGLNKDLSEERLKICKRCPLYSDKFGGFCNNKLYIDPNTGKVSIEKKDGYVRGCGCRLQAKTTIADATCIIGKW